MRLSRPSSRRVVLTCALLAVLALLVSLLRPTGPEAIPGDGSGTESVVVPMAAREPVPAEAALRPAHREPLVADASAPRPASRNTPARVGRVLDLAGTPLVNAFVVTAAGARISVDAEARFVLDPEPADRSPRTVLVGAPGFAQRRLTLAAADPALALPLEVRLAPAWRVRGRVVDAGGTGLAGVRVRSLHTEKVLAVTTGGDGGFELDMLDATRGRDCIVATRDDLEAVAEWIDARWVGPEVRIVMGSGVIVAGEVLGPAGLPVAGADVRLDDGSGVLPVRTTRCDPAGRFAFRAVGRGTQTLLAEAPDLAAASHLVHVAPGSAPPRVTLRLDAPSACCGVCVDPDGNPVAGVRIQAHLARGSSHDPGTPVGASTVSGADGAFRLSGLPPTETLLKTSRTGYADRNLLAPVPWPESLRIVMPALVAVEGRVLDQATRAPVQEFVLRVLDAGPASANGRARGEVWCADPEGRFRLTEANGVRTPCAVEVVSRGRARTTVTIERVDRERDLVILVPRGHDLRGKVVDRTTKLPVAGARLAIVGEGALSAAVFEDPSAALATTDLGGRFAFSDVAAGAAFLAVRHADYALQRSEAIAVGGVAECTVEIVDSARVLGVVRDASGKPVAGARVTLTSVVGASRRERTTDAEGRFAFGWGLSDGSYRLVARSREKASDAGATGVLVELRLGVDRSVDLVLE